MPFAFTVSNWSIVRPPRPPECHSHPLDRDSAATQHCSGRSRSKKDFSGLCRASESPYHQGPASRRALPSQLRHDRLLDRPAHSKDRSLHVAPRHGKRLGSQEVADQEGVRTALSRKGPGGVAKIVWAKIGEASTGPKVAPAGSEGRQLQVRAGVTSTHYVPLAHLNGRQQGPGGGSHGSGWGGGPWVRGAGPRLFEYRPQSIKG